VVLNKSLKLPVYRMMRAHRARSHIW